MWFKTKKEAINIVTDVIEIETASFNVYTFLIYVKTVLFKMQANAVKSYPKVIKAATVSFKIHTVLIEAETDWVQMAGNDDFRKEMVFVLSL